MYSQPPPKPLALVNIQPSHMYTQSAINITKTYQSKTNTILPNTHVKWNPSPFPQQKKKTFSSLEHTFHATSTWTSIPTQAACKHDDIPIGPSILGRYHKIQGNPGNTWTGLDAISIAIPPPITWPSALEREALTPPVRLRGPPSSATK